MSSNQIMVKQTLALSNHDILKLNELVNKDDCANFHLNKWEIVYGKVFFNLK